MKLKPVYLFLFMFAFMLAGCAQRVGIPRGDLPTLVPTPKLELIPIEIGDIPANSSHAIVGTWQVTDFTISSKGTISGKLEMALDHPVEFPYQQDVLIVQVWAYYVWPRYGDYTIEPAGEFIPVKASPSTKTSATFDINGNFDIPTLMLDIDGGMPLDHFQVTMVWYRQAKIYGYAAKIGYPENFSDQPDQGEPVFDQNLSLNGIIDTDIRRDLNYSEWFKENLTFPTDTPVVYPEPRSTPSPVPASPYPMTPYP